MLWISLGYSRARKGSCIPPDDCPRIHFNITDRNLSAYYTSIELLGERSFSSFSGSRECRHRQTDVDLRPFVTARSIIPGNIKNHSPVCVNPIEIIKLLTSVINIAKVSESWGKPNFCKVQSLKKCSKNCWRNAGMISQAEDSKHSALKEKIYPVLCSRSTCCGSMKEIR